MKEFIILATVGIVGYLLGSNDMKNKMLNSAVQVLCVTAKEVEKKVESK